MSGNRYCEHAANEPVAARRGRIEIRPADRREPRKCRRRRRSSCIRATRLRFAARSKRRKPGIIVPILVGPAAKIKAVAREHNIDIGKFELVDVPHSDARPRKGGRADPRGQGRNADERQPAYRRTDAGRHRIEHRFAYGAAHQPRLHHGCADAYRNVVHHRRRDQHFSRPRRQARHHSERHRPVHRRSGSASRASPFFPPSKPSRPRFRRPSMRRRSARWPIAAKSPAAILDGPLAFDNAIDPEAARIKGIHSPVAGQRADPGRARSRSRQHARKKSHIPRRRPIRRGWCSAPACRSC